jgi:hypothetical protein
MRAWYTDEFTRHRAPLVTGIHGGDRDWAAAATALLTRTRLQPNGDSTFRLLAAIDIDLAPGDRLSRPAGSGDLEWFEVDGEPQRYRSPHGSTDHSETALKGVPSG